MEFGIDSSSDIGKVITVRGRVDPELIGITLMHEHLFLDLRKNHLPHPLAVDVPGRSEPLITSDDFPATELEIWESKLDSKNLHLANTLAPISDNYLLTDETVAINEVNSFKKSGGGTIVDVTSIGLKRDPEALRRVSEATGLHLVMGTGYYQKVFHPEDMDERTVENLTSEIVQLASKSTLRGAAPESGCRVKQAEFSPLPTETLSKDTF